MLIKKIKNRIALHQFVNQWWAFKLHLKLTCTHKIKVGFGPNGELTLLSIKSIQAASNSQLAYLFSQNRCNILISL
jgi:hypothetical protein